MKKTVLLVMALMIVVSGTAFASMNIPKRKPLPDISYANCLNNVEVEADNLGLKSPWVGGGISYYVFVEPKYNACSCKYMHQPWPYKDGVAAPGAWSC